MGYEICCSMNDMMLHGGIYVQSILWWTHPFIWVGFCVLQLKLLTKDQMALFLRRDSKGPGAVSTYPCVRKMKDGKFEATYRVNWKRRRYTHAFQYACMNLSFTTCCTCLISLPFCSDHEWMSWTLVSRLMQSALCNGDPSCATERRGGRNNMGLGVHHQFVGNYVVMRYWWWVLIAITSCCSFRFCLFWQSGGWTLGLIQHRGRSSQVSESCMSSCCSSHTAGWIKFSFSFPMILVLIKPLA